MPERTSLPPATSAQLTERQQRRMGATEVLLGKVLLLQGPAFEVLLVLWRTVLEVEVLLEMLPLWRSVLEALLEMLLLWEPVVEVEELLEKMLLLLRPGLDGQEVELRELRHLVLAARHPARTAVRRAPIPKMGDELMPVRLETLHQTNQHQATEARPLQTQASPGALSVHKGLVMPLQHLHRELLPGVQHPHALPAPDLGQAGRHG